MNIMSLVDAYDRGEKAARALKVGDVFLGAMPECVAAGIPTDSPHGRLFMSGFLDSLPARVVTGMDNRLVEY